MGQQPKDRKEREEDFIYEVGKIAFVVEPIYQEDAARTVHDAILGLMVEESGETGLQGR